MNAAQFIPAAAAVFGIPETELRTVDRALADAGLREKALGRSFPEFSRTEAVRLLLGACASTRLTEADKTVSDVQKFMGVPPYGTEDDAFCRASFRFSAREAQSLTILQALERVCGWLASSDAPEWGVEVEIAVGGPIHIQAHDWDTGRRASMQFIGVLSHEGYPGIETVRHVRKHALKWIGTNTEVRV